MRILIRSEAIRGCQTLRLRDLTWLGTMFRIQYNRRRCR